MEISIADYTCTESVKTMRIIDTKRIRKMHNVRDSYQRSYQWRCWMAEYN